MSNRLATIGPIAALACAATLGALVIQRRARHDIPVILDPGHPADGGGAACLAMVLAYQGHPAPLADIRAAIVAEQGGADPLQMIHYAEAHGLVGRGQTVAIPGDLAKLPRATILHLRDASFVLLDRIGTSMVTVIDPAQGRRTLTVDELGSRSDGLALTFAPRR
jgi:ABC-type bacteriocin/lantibiotic exporter with double-glycine peptidase domain